MNDDMDKDLWDLLGKSSLREASPMFTQNVLRAVRQEKKSFRHFLSLAKEPKWAISALAACVTIACVSIMLLNPGMPSAGSLADASVTDEELRSLEQTAMILGTENSDTSLIELASCYSDSLSEEELQYVLAYL